MGEPAAEDPSGGAGSVERRRVHLDLRLLARRLDHHGSAVDKSGSGARVRVSAQDPLQAEVPRGGEGGGVEEAREEGLTRAFGDRHWKKGGEI